jgi:hypothetical protein
MKGLGEWSGLFGPVLAGAPGTEISRIVRKHVYEIRRDGRDLI